MQAVSLIIMGFLELMFIIITYEQRSSKETFTAGTFVIMLLLIPIFYILNN